MRATVKVLHSTSKVSKMGRKYKKVLVLVSIEGNDFVNTYIIFPTK